MTQKIILWITMTLCFVVVGLVGTFVIAIFDPNIPNEPILAIIGPSFQTITGGFIGLITGLYVGKNEE